MCNSDCIRFAELYLTREELEGKNVLEVGSLNVNGSIRDVVGPLRPASYHGVDMVLGPGVDERCDIRDLVRRYGRNRFDAVITTEVLEHIRDWRLAISNLKNVLKDGGVLLVTTRSRGFPYHGYPHDYWRFETGDLQVIFSDLSIEALASDPSCPGVFMKARREASFRERGLASHQLYSMLSRRRCRDVNAVNVCSFRVVRSVRSTASRILPSVLRSRLRNMRWSLGGAERIR
jgi:SAM-dependent methyltransferase